MAIIKRSEKGSPLTHVELDNNFTELETNKVDKVTGKALSTNDYTTAEKDKLTGIQAGAQVNTVTSVSGKTGAVTLAKADVGLGSVDNTSDAAKPVSTAQQTALDGKVDKAQLLTGTELNLSNISGNNYNFGAASSAVDYTMVSPVINGYAHCLINAASEPSVVLNFGVKEVASLQITGGATADGNVTVGLDGVNTNIAVDNGIAEVANVSITAAPTAIGNVTVTLNGVGTNIAVDPAIETTAIAVADKIRGTAFTGWTTGGAAGTDTVTFTSSTTGVKTDTTYSAGTTGATGSATTTTQGVNADTAIQVADKIRATAFSGWTVGGTAGTDTITFTSNKRAARTDSTYSAGSTGATGTMTTVTQGINDTTATKISGADFVANTNMEMVVESKDGTNVRYFFLKI